MASIHVSPSFLKPHALAGTLTPSGLPSLPPDFAPCWKALHHAQGTLGSCSHQLPGFPPLRLSKSSVAKSSLPCTSAERGNHCLGEQASSLSHWGGWHDRITGPPRQVPGAPLALLGLLLCLQKVQPLAALLPLPICSSRLPTSNPNS